LSIASREVFVDTSGFFALLIRDDPAHARAARVLADARKNKRRFLTSDYCIDESATLLVARGKAHLAAALFDFVLASRVCRLEWLDPARFEAARSLFLKHVGQGWSFTDCTSFHIMRELRLEDALTKDEHFERAGFRALLRG